MRTLTKAFGLGLFTLAACGEPVDPDELIEDAVDATEAMAIEGNLVAFENDPNAFLNTVPTKIAPMANAYFSADAVANKDFIGAKHRTEVSPTRVDPEAKSDAWRSDDWARNLVDDYSMTRLASMYRYKKVNLPESPWSDDYWALYAGSIAKRYSDPALPSGSDWKAITDYLKTRQPANLDNLSPAEKYDLLVGDANKGMTAYNINTGKAYYDSSGKVETWMGICHGWAPAAYMLPRPQKSVEVLAADGVTRIKFYPSDIKALGTLLWANARTAPTRFIGGRCNVKDPKKDSIGRITDVACRDTNAGTWHLAVVNQLGKGKRSFVVDATYDYEVWNQPMTGYDYAYFNPKTNVTSSTLAGAKVAVGSFPTDKFKAYRAAGTTHIVGIAMNVRWVVETSPSHSTTDSPARDAISGARYLYTLELDVDGNIIGGEWMQNAHPDFLWTPTKDALARSSFDSFATGTWNGTTAMPASWRSAAASASRNGQPLASVVTKLIDLARQ